MTTSVLPYARYTSLNGATVWYRSSHHFRIALAPLKQKCLCYYPILLPFILSLLSFFSSDNEHLDKHKKRDLNQVPYFKSYVMF